MHLHRQHTHGRHRQHRRHHRLLGIVFILVVIHIIVVIVIIIITIVAILIITITPSSSSLGPAPVADHHVRAPPLSLVIMIGHHPHHRWATPLLQTSGHMCVWCSRHLIIAAILSNLGSSFSVRKLFKFIHRIDLNRFPTMMAVRTAATSDSSPAAVAEPGGTTACPGPAPVTEPDARGTTTEPGTHGTTAASTGPTQNKRTRRLPFDVSPSSKWISKTPPAKRPSAEVGPPPPGHAFVMPTG